VLGLLGRLKADHGLALLFITHDWSAARTLADRVAVMQDGRVVRQGTAGDILGRDRAVEDTAAVMGSGSGPG
jgi:peptide/nickel transport system ATP-binding protein